MSKKTFRRTVFAFLAALGVLTGVLYAMNQHANAPLRGVLITMTADPDYEFWEFVGQGAREGAREYGMELEITGPASEEDATGQARLVREAISRQPDVIMLAPVNQDELREAAEEVKQAGISLVFFDSRLADRNSSGPEDCFVGINNRQAARSLAREMTTSLAGKGKVAILTGVSNSSTLSDRVAGIQEQLELAPDIEVVDTVACGDNAEVAYRSAKKLLSEHPDLAGVFSTNPVVNEGVARALRERGVDEQHIFFYAFDTSASQNAYLEEGIVDGFMAQLAFNLGYLAVEAGYQAGRQLLRTSEMDSGYVYANKENMREESIQKLIYPFVSN